METTVITELRQTVVTDRRYRRSEKVTQALAYQCAHIRDGLELEAMVVSDDTGDRWVGAGDKSLCRLLSRSANSLAGFSDQDARERRITAIKALKSDLDPGCITTYAIEVPAAQRFVFVTGVGRSRLRDNGIVSAADGVKRILGYDARRPAPSEPEFVRDPEKLLQAKVDEAFSFVAVSRSFADAVPPRSFFGRVDDRCYREATERILGPAIQVLERSGLKVGSLARRSVWRGPEVAHMDGTFTRRLRLPLLEARSKTRLGAMEVDVDHRHDRFEISRPPRIRLLWV